jgi:hypothetical protein
MTKMLVCAAVAAALLVPVPALAGDRASGYHRDGRYEEDYIPARKRYHKRYHKRVIVEEPLIVRRKRVVVERPVIIEKRIIKRDHRVYDDDYEEDNY